MARTTGATSTSSGTTPRRSSRASRSSPQRVAVGERAVVIEERAQVGGLAAFGRGSFIEVAEEDDVVAGIDESVCEAPDLSRLTQTSVASASGLALEVIDEHEHVGAALCPDLVFGAVAGEDDAVAVFGVDVGSDRADREAGLAHDPDIDAAFVVAVHEHQVPVSRV